MSANKMIVQANINKPVEQTSIIELSFRFIFSNDHFLGLVLQKIFAKIDIRGLWTDEDKKHIVTVFVSQKLAQAKFYTYMGGN